MFVTSTLLDTTIKSAVCRLITHTECHSVAQADVFSCVMRCVCACVSAAVDKNSVLIIGRHNYRESGNVVETGSRHHIHGSHYLLTPFSDLPNNNPAFYNYQKHDWTGR